MRPTTDDFRDLVVTCSDHAALLDPFPDDVEDEIRLMQTLEDCDACRAALARRRRAHALAKERWTLWIQRAGGPHAALAALRRAVWHPADRQAPPARAGGWARGPLALAAVALLGVGLGYSIPRPTVAPVALPAPPAMVAVAPVVLEPPSAVQAPAASTGECTPRRSPAPSAKRSVVPAPEPTAAPPPPPEPAAVTVPDPGSDAVVDAGEDPVLPRGSGEPSRPVAGAPLHLGVYFTGSSGRTTAVRLGEPAYVHVTDLDADRTVTVCARGPDGATTRFWFGPLAESGHVGPRFPTGAAGVHEVWAVPGDAEACDVPARSTRLDVR